jgi:hypothetical protein
MSDFASKRFKHSVINFYSAVELFFKARLMLEHWTLILEDASVANLEKFIQGDFRSVGAEQAWTRLTNIKGETYSGEEKATFRALRNHRNRFVHFLHPASAG